MRHYNNTRKNERKKTVSISCKLFTLALKDKFKTLDWKEKVEARLQFNHLRFAIDIGLITKHRNKPKYLKQTKQKKR